VPQPDGTLRCPAGHPLSVYERRPERNGSVRVVYGARITHCRPCPKRQLCQASSTTRKARQVSAVLWPVENAPPSPPVQALPALLSQTTTSEDKSSPPPPLPVLWGDWPRTRLRRQWLRALHTQTVELAWCSLPSEEDRFLLSDDVQTRAQRAHYRLSWQQRLARNARPASDPSLEITIYGLPDYLAHYISCAYVLAA
jgi:hypothetical protein